MAGFLVMALLSRMLLTSLDGLDCVIRSSNSATLCRSSALCLLSSLSSARVSRSLSLRPLSLLVLLDPLLYIFTQAFSSVAIRLAVRDQICFDLLHGSRILAWSPKCCVSYTQKFQELRPTSIYLHGTNDYRGYVR